MKSDLDTAKKLLKEGYYTCVLCRDGKTVAGIERGVKPLIAFVESGRNFSGFCAADKIVGKAAALLYVLLGVHTVFAEVMSEAGRDTLARHRITPLYNTCVKEIRNRTDTGMCPMEETVERIDDPDEGLLMMKNKLAAMKKIKVS